MTKRILALILALCLVATVFAACGGDSGESSSSAAGDTSSSSSESAPADDGGSSEDGDASTPEDGGAAVSGEGSMEAAGLKWHTAEEVEGDDAPAGEIDERAFQKFDEVVEVHFASSIDPVDTTLSEGEDAANNQYTRYLEENFNIKFVSDWTVGSTADFQQKISLQIASASLPDGIVVPNRSYMVKAAQSELLADLHDVYDQYASKQVKQIMESTDGRAYSNGTYDGTFVGLPNVSVETDGIYIYFIRQDWLDELKIEVPKTIAELEAAAQKFKDEGKSPKYSIAGVGQGVRSYANFLESGNKSYGFDAVYQAKDAYPGFFYYEGDELVYGTNTQQTRDTLEILADWYKKGLINPELGVATNGDEAAGVKEGTCGIFMGPWWSLGYGNGDSFKNDPTADWQAYPLYSDDGKWNVKIKDCGSSYTIVSADASDDVKKAIIITNNVLVRDESIFDTSVAIGWYPLRNTMAAMDECEYEYNALMDVLKGEKTAEDYNIPGNIYKNLYTDAVDLPTVFKEDFKGDRNVSVNDMDVMTNNGQFNRYYALLVGDRPYATLTPDKKVESVIYYTIDEFDTYWTQLQDLEDQTIMSIMTGQADISAFDTYVQNWKAQGGDTILAAVDAFVKAG
ncbi:MAG: extracellular solute-binding protein [Acutalibacter sp.]|nr:extracellular solute-binding protein [Acutalibacter sp.]